MGKNTVEAKQWLDIHKIVSGDRKLKLRETADTLKILKGSVFTILHKSLGMRKLISKWVPRFAHFRPKTTVRRGFRARFGAVQAR